MGEYKDFKKLCWQEMPKKYWRQWSRKKLCNEVEIRLTADRVSIDGGCEAGVTIIIIQRWVRSRECGKLLYGRRFPLLLNGAVRMNNVRPTILYVREAWCLQESKMGIL